MIGLTLNAHAFSSKAFFGGNNTFESRDAHGFFAVKKRSVAMMLSEGLYDDLSGEKFEIYDFMLDLLGSSEGLGLCSDEPFANQPGNPQACTGFLVAPNILATAGHCVSGDGRVKDTVTRQCDQFSWIFDYELADSNDVIFTGQSREQLYHCKKVIMAYSDYKLEEDNHGYPYGHDMALIELDRPVTGREILTIATMEPTANDTVSVIGHPLGLPQKVGINGLVTANEHPYFFEAAIDSFAGSSGSPIFNERGEVSGILVRGPNDLYYDEVSQCHRLNRCNSVGSHCSGTGLADQEFKRGMHIQKSHYLLEFLK